MTNIPNIPTDEEIAERVKQMSGNWSPWSQNHDPQFIRWSRECYRDGARAGMMETRKTIRPVLASKDKAIAELVGALEKALHLSEYYCLCVDGYKCVQCSIGEEVKSLLAKYKPNEHA